jgi:DNA-directed RNA polymerase specialized sigma24 family protein
MGDAFTEYVSARGATLLRFAYVLCGDRHLAEDLVQSVLARIYRRWRQVEAAESPDAYVRRSIVHEYLSWRRRLSSRELAIDHLPERVAPGGATIWARGTRCGACSAPFPGLSASW